MNENLTTNKAEPQTLESGIFSTFVYDPQMLEPLLKKFKIKAILIKDSSGEKLPQIEQSKETPTLTLIHPKINSSLHWGKYHSKLIILKFPKCLRVIVPTANITLI